MWSILAITTTKVHTHASVSKFYVFAICQSGGTSFVLSTPHSVHAFLPKLISEQKKVKHNSDFLDLYFSEEIKLQAYYDQGLFWTNWQVCLESHSGMVRSVCLFFQTTNFTTSSANFITNLFSLLRILAYYITTFMKTVTCGQIILNHLAVQHDC